MTRHRHDCEKCEYLGDHEEFDLYYCHGSVIARYGNTGPDYISAPVGVIRTVISTGEGNNREFCVLSEGLKRAALKSLA